MSGSAPPGRGVSSRPVPIYQAVVLGIVQGLTEFAPVSSSGHLILVPWLFHWPILNDVALNKTFDVALHMGTFFGALAYFWRDISKYLAGFVRSISHRSISQPDERLAWLILAGTIPGAVVGAGLESVIEEKLGAPWLIAIMLIAFGIVLYLVDRLADHRRQMDDIGLADALIIGMAQAVALQPGVSRSGVTITAARARGLDRETAARFSFLLALPIIGGAGVLKSVDLLKEGLPPGLAAPFFWGFIASAVSGFLVIWLLLGYVRRRDFAPFVVYRVLAGLVVLGIIVSGVRGATI
jgi:undecaprenyl-diphosphatase